MTDIHRIYASVVQVGDVLRLPDGDHVVTSVRLVGEDVRIELGANRALHAASSEQVDIVVVGTE